MEVALSSDLGAKMQLNDGTVAARCNWCNVKETSAKFAKCACK